MERISKSAPEQSGADLRFSSPTPPSLRAVIPRGNLPLLILPQANLRPIPGAMHARFLLLALPLAACGGAQPSPAAAPAPAEQTESAAFLVTMGRDTLSAERYTLAGGTLSGEVFTRTPRTVSRSYQARLGPDGSIQRIEVTARTLAAPPATPATVTTVEFTGDSALVRIARGDSVTTQRVAAARGTLPFVGGSYAVYEAAMRHLRRTGRARGDFPLLVPGSSQRVNVTFDLAADSGVLSNIAGRSFLRTDAVGRLLALDGRESTQKVLVQRMSSLDVAALASAFAQREATGQGLGTLSPRDSAVLQLGGGRIVVDYGRPARRGRRIVGDIVPYDAVWRTGANAATGFTTTRDLMIGSAHVPAGSYTLWTLPSRTGWKLIINRQTGQWGTEYHPEQDLVRVDLERRSTPGPVELFTIVLEPTGASTAALKLSWDDTELIAPITVH